MSYQFPTLDSGDQSIGARYPFLEDGTHRLVIHRIAVRGRSKAMFIIESEVLETNNTECPPGSRRSSFIDLTNADMRGKNIAGFLAAVFGVEPTTLAKGSTTTPWDGRTWTEYAAWSASEQNPLAGRKVDAFVQTIQTQEGSDFSAHNWSPAGTLTMQPPISIPSASKTQRAPAGPQGAAPGFTPPGFASWRRLRSPERLRRASGRLCRLREERRWGRRHSVASCRRPRLLRRSSGCRTRRARRTSTTR
jgi:hypothetical protein